MKKGGKYQLRRNDLLYPELSFRINGALFEVFKQLGGGHKEKTYQKAVALALEQKGIRYKEQVHVPLVFNGNVVGRYYLDFLVEDNIVLELKRGRYVPAQIINQTKGYLSSLDLKLAIIGCFAQDCVLIKRILNQY